MTVIRSQVNSRSSVWPVIKNCRPHERIWQRIPDEGFVRFGATVYAMRAKSNNSQLAAPDRVVSTPAEAPSTPATERLGIRPASETACPHCACASVIRRQMQAAASPRSPPPLGVTLDCFGQGIQLDPPAPL